MSVTFDTPVVVEFATTTSLTFNMTGVTSGQPIIVTALCSSTEFANGATVSGMGYTATLVQYAARNESFAQWILTGGSGTSGTITVTGLPSDIWAGFAVACVGASIASGLSAIESYGNSGSSSAVTSMTWSGLNINAANSGALYFAVLAAVAGSINGFPSGFTTSTANNGTYTYGALSTLSAPPVGALPATWTSTVAAGWNFGGLTVLAATPSYQVVFNANGGTGTMANEVASAPTALTSNAFTYAGFVFTGWNTIAGGSGTAYANAATYPFTTSATLYAQWAPANPIVTFNANGGSGTMSPQSEPYGTVADLTPNAFTLTGYNFVGWNTAADGTGTAYANQQSFTFVANVTLYAQFVIDQYVIADTSATSGVRWQSPTPGQATLVGHVNQLLTTHSSLFVYDGAVIGTDPTLAGTAVSLGVGMLAQTFTVGAPVNLGSVLLALGALGAGQDVLVTLQADSGGSPSGTPLVGCVVPPEWLPSGVASGPSIYSVPLPYALAAGTYWIVLQPGSDLLSYGISQLLAGVDDVQLTQSTAVSGASVYSGGSWTTETYGFGVYLRDYTGSQLRAIADDAIPGLAFSVPAKVASYNYTSGQLTNVFEWVVRSLNVTPNVLCRDDASFEVTIGSAVVV